MKILFIVLVCIVLYTYIGYGIVLWIMVKIKEALKKKPPLQRPSDLPEVTLLIAAYNEEEIVAEKMKNCQALNYPKDKLHIAWVTDGSNDRTNERLAEYPEVNVWHKPERKGKSAAINRAVPLVKTPITIFTDANTMLNSDSILEIVTLFTDPSVGCVAGEKRIQMDEKANSNSVGEGLYWKYESKLKELDYRLYSVVGAAGELFAIRTNLYFQMPQDTLLDDFILSLSIAKDGYRTGYSSNAYAVETGSADIHEEEKRKIRIAAGGIQSILRLLPLLNIFKYG
ncbi:MAG: glycosyltransferase family 2 protein, partial [Bacteroidales bacterium]